MFTRGRRALEVPLSESKFVLQDGSAGTFVLNFSDHPEALRAVRLSLYSAAMVLKEEPSVFIIGVGGGNDVWAAKHGEARLVKGVELNEPILDIHREVLPCYSRVLLEDPTIELMAAEGRSSLIRERESYDVIQMTGIDTWTALASGAHVLAETTSIPIPARPSRTPMLVCARRGSCTSCGFAATMESLRLLANVDHALTVVGAGDIRDSMICLATWDQLFSVILKKGRFTDRGLDRIEVFAREAVIRPVYVPGRTSLSRSDPVHYFLATEDQQGFIRSFPRDISPTTDDRPYFFNYSKWSRPFESAKSAGAHTAAPRATRFCC